MPCIPGCEAAPIYQCADCNQIKAQSCRNWSADIAESEGRRTPHCIVLLENGGLHSGILTRTEKPIHYGIDRSNYHNDSGGHVQKAYCDIVSRDCLKRLRERTLGLEVTAADGVESISR